MDPACSNPVDDPRLKDLLSRFIAKYMNSQKVHTKMRIYPEQCHQYRGDDLLPTITICGHEETMHAAVVEDYRLSGDKELLEEAVSARGVGFLENPVYGGVRIPARFESLENAHELYGYYGSQHTRWVRSRDAIHYRAEGLIRLFQVTGDEHWIRLAARRASNYMRYVGAFVGNEFLDVASVVRMNTADPESFGEGWIPHYAWEGDFENRSAGSRLMSPWITAVTLLRAADAGFAFDGNTCYTGPLKGVRKLLDAASLPEAITPGSLEGYFDLPDGKHGHSKLLLKNHASVPMKIESIRLNGEMCCQGARIESGETLTVDILAAGKPGRQNDFQLALSPQSAGKVTLHHSFAATGCRLFATAMNESFGGNFYRRNIVFHNPYAPIEEKSFHDPMNPDSYYRALPSDEGYETQNESSYVRTWKPFLELVSLHNVERRVNSASSSEITVSRMGDDKHLILYDALWTDENGETLNGALVDDDEALSFPNPTSRLIARARKAGDIDPLHPECTLPLSIYKRDEGIHADLINYIGASALVLEIFEQGPIILGLPVYSENTVISFNGEEIYADRQLKTPNGFSIRNAKEKDGYIRPPVTHPGRIEVRIGSRAEVPGSPVGLAASWIDSILISSKSIRLPWQAGLEPDVGHYDVYRKDEHQEEFAFVGWTPETVFTDYSTRKDRAYAYQVSAVSKMGDRGRTFDALSPAAPGNLPPCSCQHPLDIDVHNLAKNSSHSTVLLIILAYYCHIP